ncbi:MAG: hypothetical protein JO180_01665 [Gemmatirosa sp.]|nr:hypothetical protein [Gemmatirosa sp.]
MPSTSLRTRFIRWATSAAIAGTLVGALVGAIAALPARAAAQMFAQRVMIPVPLDDSTRPRGLLPGFSYLADVQRGWRSAGDDRAWDARLSGTIEVWRASPRTTIVIGTADELVANSLKDGGFNPRGIGWELSAGVAHRVGGVTVQLDFAHDCRHAVDDVDPPGPAYYIPGYVPTQRTLSVNGPRLRVVSPWMRAGSRVRARGAVGGTWYLGQWDGRQTQNEPDQPHPVDSWGQARGSATADVRIEATVVRGSAVFVRGATSGIFFAHAPDAPVTARARASHRLELGWRVPGRAGSVEVYGAAEHLFDDVASIVPRTSNVVGVGLRLAERNQF